MLKSEFDSQWETQCSYLIPKKSKLGHVFQNEKSISLTNLFSRPCLARKENINYEINYKIDLEKDSVISDSPSEVNCPIVEAWSHDKTLIAKVFKRKEKDKTFNFIEIWSASYLTCSIDLSKNKIHDRIYSEETFSSLVWSKDKTKLFYIAESVKSEENNFEYQENFGDRLTEVFSPNIFCLEIATKVISKVIDLPKNIYPCKLFYNENFLYFLAYEFDDFIHGGLHCTNHQKSLFKLKEKGLIEKLTPNGITVASCAFNPKFPYIFVWECQVGGPHLKAVDLVVINKKNMERTTILKEIYVKDFPSECWLNTETEPGLVLNMICGPNSILTLKGVQRVNGKWEVFDIVTDDKFNYSLLSAFTVNFDESVHLCICSKSNTFTPWSLVLIKLSVITEKSIKIFSKEISLYAQGFKRKKAPKEYIRRFCFDSNRKIVEEDKCVYSGFMILPEKYDFSKSTILIITHGGPHALLTIEYDRIRDLLLENGIIIFSVNYRGSLGFDEKSLSSLYGKIGKQDVEDVHFSFLSVIESLKITTDKIMCYGCSHGGYISASLISHYPNFYKGGLLMNPVLDLFEMITTSDIPEWTFIGAGLEKNSHYSIQEKELEKIWKKSPISYFENIKCPVLLLLGSKDKRVTHQQGLHFRRLLKSRGVKIETYVYSDWHNFIEIPHQTSSSYEIINFIKKYLTE